MVRHVLFLKVILLSSNGSLCSGYLVKPYGTKPWTSWECVLLVYLNIMGLTQMIGAQSRWQLSLIRWYHNAAPEQAQITVFVLASAFPQVLVSCQAIEKWQIKTKNGLPLVKFNKRKPGLNCNMTSEQIMF